MYFLEKAIQILEAFENIVYPTPHYITFPRIEMLLNLILCVIILPNYFFYAKEYL